MKNGLITGILLIAAGIFMIYWAQAHSPKDLGNVLGNAISGSYTMSKNGYYFSLGSGILVGIIGLLRTFKSMK